MVLSFRSRKRFIKAVFWVLVIALGAGLVGSSVLWTRLPDEPAPEVSGSQNGSIDSEITKAEANKDVATLLLIAGRLVDGGDVKRAEEVYQKVLKISPDNTAARMSLVEQYFIQSNYKEASAQVETILKKAPDHQTALYYRGLIRGYGDKDYAGAVQDLKRFVDLAKTGREVEQAQGLIAEWTAEQKKGALKP
ncbi:MAG: tetratricopeptide repeat protein [Bacillota bacterium]